MDTSDYILLSELNDFIFCPRSIYWHHIFGRYDTSLYHTTDQTLGNIAHRAIDQRKYSTRKNILQGISVISHEYGIQGKIDIYNTKTWILSERKRLIKKVYKWYEWQLYGQYFCLSEMGYVITGLELYSKEDNKKYPIPFPDNEDREIFINMIKRFQNYRLENNFEPNKKKCERCIYNTLCDKSLV